MIVLDQVKTRLNLWRHRGQPARRLEIGPGPHALPGFETLSIRGGRWVDYVADAGGRLPFASETFAVVYASHVLEHIPWYQTEAALQEWTRIIRPGGRLEVWVPDGQRICQAFLDAERGDPTGMTRDAWNRFDAQRDPCRWAAGRLFTYGDGDGRPGGPNWHRALFTPRYLQEVLSRSGLVEVRLMDPAENRGPSHGWINLGATGAKP